MSFMQILSPYMLPCSSLVVIVRNMQSKGKEVSVVCCSRSMLILILVVLIDILD